MVSVFKVQSSLCGNGIVLMFVGIHFGFPRAGPVDVIRQPQAEKNKFLQDLDNEELDQMQMMEEFGGTTNAATADRRLPSINNQSDVASPYHLDKDVHVWTDFNRSYFHTKTLCQVPQFTHGDSFDSFSFANGMDVYRSTWMVNDDVQILSF